MNYPNYDGYDPSVKSPEDHAADALYKYIVLGLQGLIPRFGIRGSFAITTEVFWKILSEMFNNVIPPIDVNTPCPGDSSHDVSEHYRGGRFYGLKPEDHTPFRRWDGS